MSEDTRKAFEEWAVSVGISTERSAEWYRSFDTERYWTAWQAATEASSARIARLEEALRGLMEVESRGRVMPIGREWNAARSALEDKQ